MQKVGNPHEYLPPVFHIAGTNGKGSTQAFLRALFEGNGQSVHSFIGPHLISIHERIRIAGKLITDEQFDTYINHIKQYLGKDDFITFFEFVMAIGFYAFAHTKADVTLLETGLGGRLDATNIVSKPACAIITRLSYDHQSWLGDTIEKIATEKAGIIKQGCPVVIGYQEYETTYDVIEAIARIKQAPVYRYGREWSIQIHEDYFIYESKQRTLKLSYPSLEGEHQAYNAGNALAALEASGLWKEEMDIDTSLQNTYWPARLQKIENGVFYDRLPEGSLCYVDGGHNDSAGDVLAPFLEHRKQETNLPVFCIIGMLNNKDIARFMQPMRGAMDAFCGIEIEGKEGGSYRAEEIVHLLGNPSNAKPVNSYDEAIAHFNTINQGKPYMLFVLGSLYQAGDFLAKNGYKIV